MNRIRNLFPLVILTFYGFPAFAGLEICNDTNETQAISVGYKGDDVWTSEGWWNLDPGGCATPIGGDLTQRYYYFRAEKSGGPFQGGNYYFCTSTTAYTIKGDTECEERGYDKEDFQEIDTGETGTEFTFRLTQSAMDVAQSGEGLGLEFCNETEFTQAVSIGYKQGEGYISRGWWNVEPGECSKPLSAALQQRYYYYRAEVSAGDFSGQGYSFCTASEAYDIEGDKDCENRGYVTEDFAEIDTGESARGFTFTLTNATGGNIENASASDGDDGLRICNETTATQEVSIGYQAEDGWTSEGWWRIEPDGCATVIDGPLKNQWYYYRAEVQGGPFDGENYTFCTTTQAYTIVGDEDCESRGYESEKFREFSIGSGTSSFVLTIGSSAAIPGGESSGDETVSETTAEPVVNAGLKVCNETEHNQSLSFGYDGADGWTSEGWWVAEPGECVTPALDGQPHRYIYYRAEVNGGEFAGQNYFFCTTPDAYTIVGDDNCASRGYDREDFYEIDTGAGEELFTFTLVSDPGSESPAGTAESVTTATDSKGGGVEFDRNSEAAVEPEPEPETNPDPGPTTQPEPEIEPEPEPEQKKPPRRGGSRGG